MQSERPVTVGGLLNTLEIIVQWLYEVPPEAGGGERWKGLLDEIEGLRKQLHAAATNLEHAPVPTETCKAKLPSSKIGEAC